MAGPATSRTLTEHDLPWDRAKDGADPEVLHVVIAWSLEEPLRVGEAAAVVEPSILGRGGPQPEDPAPRIAFHRMRPGSSVPGGHLASSRISRVQLRLSPTDGGKLEVRALGKCPLVFRGAEVESAVVEPGSTVTLKNALVLLVVKRPRALPRLRAHPEPSFRFGAPDAQGVVGESPAAWQLRDELAIAARSAHHVLIQGDSGAGKELAARAIHAWSARADKVFVARNAATFPEGLVDAELFGTAKNYPNPSTPERPGVIGEAEGGTLFLDEIGELPASSQAHLLRVLDRGGEYQRLGESRPRKADLRLVAATNRALEALKHDFAARFSARLRVPGLPERREDVPLLMRHLLRRFTEGSREVMAPFVDETSGEVRTDPRLLEGLLAHGFTHHARELERLLWLAASTSRGTFVALTPEVEAELRIAAPPTGSEEVSAEQVKTALQAANGSVTAAARTLGLKNRFVLYRLMKRYGISGGDGPDGEAEGPETAEVVEDV
jgi:DNA-binding NtrC family response regulator